MSKVSSGTIWIDLTDLSVWSGHFTGIQRVVYEYAMRFSCDGAKFFIFDKVDNRHVEVPFSYLEEVRARGMAAPLTYRQKLKRIIGQPYYKLSPAAKKWVRPIVRGLNRMARTALYHVVDKGVPYSPLRMFPLAEFARDDTVIVIGAGWNDRGSLDTLCRLHQEKGFRLVQHVNDILPIYQPQLFADGLPKVFTSYIDTILRCADAITVISQATKRDVESFCKEHGIKPPKIYAVRLGEDVRSSKPEKPADLAVTGKFVLSVGTFEIRKNYLLLYQAAKLAQLEGKEFPSIIIVGKKGWLTEDLTHVIARDPFTHDKIIWLSNVSDAGLDWLYEHCMFTVFPSLCEGWGLPIVESLQHGKFCLASSVSAMLEIGNGLVDYFSPYDARSCMDKILAYAEVGYRQKNAEVKVRYKAYTWDESYAAFRGGALAY